MTEEKQAAMNGTEWGLLLALSMLWGSSFFFYRVLVATLPPLTVVLGRVGLAAILMNLWLIARRTPMTRRLPWGAFIVLGTLNNVIPFTLFAWGETRISSGLASILNATTPVFAVLIAALVTREEKLTWARAAGITLALCGVVVLIGPDALSGLGSQNLPGEAACLLASFTYAVGGLYGRRFRSLPSLHVATGQITGAALVLLPLAAFFDHFWALPAPDAQTWGALAGISVIGTVLAYILYFRILATAGATNVLLVTFLLPISALLPGALFLGEKITGEAVLGMGFIGAGLAAIDGRVVKKASASFLKKRSKKLLV
jgi:drug/metabolite transporter (DMT)-like permease